MLVVTWEQKDGISIATLAGRIDARNTDEFQNTIESGIDSGAHAVILDFEQVFYISIAGLQTGLYIAQNLNKRASSLPFAHSLSRSAILSNSAALMSESRFMNLGPRPSTHSSKKRFIKASMKQNAKVCAGVPRL